MKKFLAILVIAGYKGYLPAALDCWAAENRGVGLFHPSTALETPYQDGARRVVVADLNHDNHLDVVFGSGTNVVWLNDGRGQFCSTGQDFAGASTDVVALLDANSDANDDLVLYKQGQMQIWLGDGKGRFSDSGQRIGSGTIRSCFAGDLNGDGFPDIVLACEAAQNRLFFNDGSGHFTESPQSLGTIGNRSYGGIAVDADGDGDLDLVFSNWDPASVNGPIHLFTNNGHGEFTESTPSFGEPGAWYRAVISADLNRDGRPDLITARFGSIETWENKSGGFSKLQEFPTWSDPWAVAAVDIDSDGDIDVIAAEYSSPGSISEIWVNDGSATLLNSGRHLCCGGYLDIAVGDLNEDGAPDLFLSGPRPAVWLNATEAPRIHIDSAGLDSVSGVVFDAHFAEWQNYFGIYLIANVPTLGWSTVKGVNTITRLGPGGAFTVGGLPPEASRIVAILAPTGANVFGFPPLENASVLPQEIETLGLARLEIELPKLSIARENGRTVVSWTTSTNGKLEIALATTGPWTAANLTQQGEYVVGIEFPAAFFRLR